jgi:hypothetical protein
MKRGSYISMSDSPFGLVYKRREPEKNTALSYNVAFDLRPPPLLQYRVFAWVSNPLLSPPRQHHSLLLPVDVSPLEV